MPALEPISRHSKRGGRPCPASHSIAATKPHERPASLVCGGPSSQGSRNASCRRVTWRRIGAHRLLDHRHRSAQVPAHRPTGAAHGSPPAERSGSASPRGEARPVADALDERGRSLVAQQGRDCGDDPRGDGRIVGPAIVDLIGIGSATPTASPITDFLPCRSSGLCSCEAGCGKLCAPALPFLPPGLRRARYVRHIARRSLSPCPRAASSTRRCR